MTPVVKRNALLLALGLVFQSGMIQLAVALGTVTITVVTGVKSILGLGPAVFLIAGALAVGPAGRLSDRVGRMPVIRGGYVLGAIGPAVTAARLLLALGRACLRSGSGCAAPASRSSFSHGPPPPRCSRRSAARAACRSSSSPSSRERSGGRSSSGRCSPGATLDAAPAACAVARGRAVRSRRARRLARRARGSEGALARSCRRRARRRSGRAADPDPRGGPG